MKDRKVPWWLWPNVLSLDAPLVAVAWLWMFAKLWKVRYQDPAVYWVLAGVVWVVYVVDRWRDARTKDEVELSERHEFHRRHGKLMLSLVGVVMVACVIGFFLGVPTAMLWNWPRYIPGADDGVGLPELFYGTFIAVQSHGIIVGLFAFSYFIFGRARAAWA